LDLEAGYRDPVREVRVRIETGKILRILTNDLDASAEEIAGLYKRRWEIELFSGLTLLAFTRLMSSNLMHLKRSIDCLAMMLKRHPTTGRWRSNACSNQTGQPCIECGHDVHRSVWI